MIEKAKAGLQEYKRVLKITKKPTRSEFKAIVKVSGLGILLIGFIGFLIQMIYQVLT
jgi:protein transport protein SEC61 subunit gamma-like protein